MKNLVYIISVLVMLFSCTDQNEPETYNFSVYLKNNSTHTIHVEHYFSTTGTLFDSYTISSTEQSENCDYVAERFRGLNYNFCSGDSVVLKFDNGRGYINKFVGIEDIYGFSGNRHLFGQQENGFTDKGNNIFEFEITEEDYENAHELP